MHAKHFAFFRGVLLCVLLLQAAYNPYAGPRTGWLPAVFAAYAALAALLYLAARRFDPRGWAGLASFVVDIAAASAVLYATEGLSGDYYVAYFLVILASCLLERLSYSFVVGAIAAAVYLSLDFPGSLGHPGAPASLLRTALLLCTALFAAYIASLFREIEEHAARKYAERLAWTQRLSMVGRAVSSLLHEIKTPLATIVLGAEWVRSSLKGSGGPEVDEQLELMGREAERTEQMLAEFLSFAKPGELAMTELEPARLVDHACELLRLRLQERKVRLERVLEPAPGVRGSERHLLQVLLNLGMNAWQAMPLGGTLTIRLRAAGGRVEIELQDTGAGLGPEELAALFEPFATGRAEGHGLGLSVARWIAQRHGGDVELRSPGLGKGSTALLTLPAWRGGAPPCRRSLGLWESPARRRES